MSDVVEKARQIITENRFLTLATCTKTGQVWIAPIAYVVDQDYNFYFYSALDSIHIEHIKYNPSVAFAIYNSAVVPDDADGLQFAGTIGQVEKADVPALSEMFWKQVFPDDEVRTRWQIPYEHFLKDEFPFQRFFQIEVSEVYKLDRDVRVVDRRIEVNLQELRQKPAKLPTLVRD
ncbi:MAG: pyridoxamine 5'-phosphate oxidase family protein [Oscillochloris sp.]|nr:pyridoxamine 5'-phosphate oxidase family protein [Oscillochloris sp.]